MKFVDWTNNGYTMLDVRPGKLQADWYFVDGIAADQGVETWGGGYSVATGDSHLVEATTPET